MKYYRKFIVCSTLMFLANSLLAQSVDVKDSDSNTLIQINDEGDNGGSISLPDASTVSSTDDKLYNVGSKLYWEGNELGAVDNASGWTDGGTDVYLITTTDNVGIGTTTPTEKLTVYGIVESTDGGFKFPDGSVQTTAATGGAPSGSGDGHSLDADDGTPTDVLYVDNDGNVGIGTTTPLGILDLTSTSGAFIVPRMTAAQRNNLPVINGSIIYNTSSNEFNFLQNGSWYNF